MGERTHPTILQGDGPLWVPPKIIDAASRAKPSDRVLVSARKSGTVKSFSAKSGYGFIIPDEGGEDVFVHITAFQEARLPPPVAGRAVTYELRMVKERILAISLAYA